MVKKSITNVFLSQLFAFLLQIIKVMKVITDDTHFNPETGQFHNYSQTYFKFL